MGLEGEGCYFSVGAARDELDVGGLSLKGRGVEAKEDPQA